MTDIGEEELDEWNVPLRTLIKLLAEERERSNVQVCELFEEIDDLRDIIRRQQEVLDEQHAMLRELAGMEPRERDRALVIN